MLTSIQRLLPKYHPGLRVKVFKQGDTWTWISTGTICGFEYIKNSEIEPEWHYFVELDKIQLFLADGTVRSICLLEFELVPESSIEIFL